MGHIHEFVPISAFGGRCRCGLEEFTMSRAELAATSRAKAEAAELDRLLAADAATQAERLRTSLGLPPELEISFSSKPVVVTVVVNDPEPPTDRA